MSPKIPDPTDMHGLTHAEVCVRLQAEEMNELPAARRCDVPAIALKGVREPMLLLLLVAGGALTFFLLTLYVLFFAPLTSYQLALSFVAGLCSVLWFELLKLIRQH